jgi:AmmeMemoRadiSam system protein A
MTKSIRKNNFINLFFILLCMNEKDGKRLLKLARESIDCVFSQTSPDLNKYSDLNEKRGCFVTLHKNNELRGCIGFVEPSFPLYRTIPEAARAAAFSDLRFPSLKQNELKDINIEVSVLTLPEPVKVEKPEDYKKKIQIGKDGLIIEGRYGSGLLLPQVATEWNFTIEQFLDCLAQKAGLSSNAWKDLNNRILKFHAEIFKEE